VRTNDSPKKHWVHGFVSKFWKNIFNMKICAVLPIVALATVLATISVSCTMAISAGDFIAPDFERKTNIKACGNTQDM